MRLSTRSDRGFVLRFFQTILQLLQTAPQLAVPPPETVHIEGQQEEEGTVGNAQVDEASVLQGFPLSWFSRALVAAGVGAGGRPVAPD